MKKWLTAGAKSGNLGESSTALESVTRERIQSVSPGEEGGEEEGQGDKEAEGSEEAVEGEEGDVLEGGEGADDDEYEKAPPSPSAEDHDDGDSNLVDIGYWLK